MSTLQASSIVQGIPAVDYHAHLALSASGMKDLAVSPLRYWYLHINPDRPERKETHEQQFGTALHCLVLEGEEVFHERYTHAVDKSDYPDCLITIEDLRGWLRKKGLKDSGTRKTELISQVRDVDSSVPIWDVICEGSLANAAGKRSISKSEFERIQNAADALLGEPQLREILRGGESEVSILTDDPKNGTPWKARLDWVSDVCILDIKTFTQKRGKSIDESVADAIYYETYYRQAFFYSTIHQRITSRKKPAKFVMAFVESDPPHEVRIKELRPATDGVMNVYWSRAQIEVNHYSRLWAMFMREYGEKPWRVEQKIEVLLDEEMRALAYA